MFYVIEYSSFIYLETIFENVGCIWKIPPLFLHHFTENNDLVKEENPPLLELGLSSWCDLWNLQCVLEKKKHSLSELISKQCLYLYNQEQKKMQHSKNRFFSYLYLSQYTLLYIKLNTIGWTSWWWKLYLKIFYNKHFILLWKRPLKNMSHKKCHFQGKGRNSFLLRVERKETRNQNNSV